MSWLLSPRYLFLQSDFKIRQGTLPCGRAWKAASAQHARGAFRRREVKLGLTTQAETLDQGLVARGIFFLQITEQAATLIHHLEQTAAGVMILLVGLEVRGEVFDAGREQCDLDFRRTGIVGHAAEFSNDLAGVDGHVCTLMMRNPQEHSKVSAPPGPPVRFCSAEPRNCSAGRLLGTRT